MRFLDAAIDLAAVLSASRSVASKHIALRSRQIDAYSRTSSVAASLRRRTVSANEREPERAAKDSGPTTEDSRPPEAGRQQDGAKEDAAPSRQAPETKSAPAVEETDLPPGVDINVFYTSRGSHILDSVRKQEHARPKRQKPTPNPSKEHPMRYWPNPPPAPSALEDAKADALSKMTIEANDSPEVTEAATSAAAVAPPEASRIDTGSGTAAADQSQSRASPQTLPEEQVEGSEKLDDSIAKVAEELGAASTLSQPTPARALRESSVPSTRFGRLWNYGGLAAGMIGGAMTEGVTRAFGGGGEGSVLLSGKNMERLVSRLSRMRGAALKLGQMMSFQDSKMLPKPIQEVLQRVQDRADYMPAWQRDRVLSANLGPEWRDLFSEFEETPIAAASIGQVHRATLRSNGKPVAVKIQFPGVADSINSDLDNLGILLNATKLLPKGLYLDKTIDNARVELGWECDYEREARCAQRYGELLSGDDDVFLVPGVYPEASGRQVLTMDFMDGVTVTRVQSFTQEQRDWIGTQIMRLCLREITEFKFMQTDPNWTNFLYDAERDRVVLLDFGASREYPDEFVRQYVQLLEAASRSDREAVRALSESLGYLTGHESRAMLDAHTQSVLTLAEPFLATAPEVYDFRDQTITERVKALIPVMLQERLAPPPEETYSLHRKLSGAFLLCARLGSKVRCRELFAQSVARSGYVEGKSS